MNRKTLVHAHSCSRKVIMLFLKLWYHNIIDGDMWEEVSRFASGLEWLRSKHKNVEETGEWGQSILDS